MLHGWGATSQSFDALAAHLAVSYRVIRLDLPGFGGTQTPPTPWHIQDYAEFTAATLRKLGVAHLTAALGHSFGGRVLIKALARGLISPDRLILLDSAGVKHSASARNQIFKAVAKAGKAVTALPGLSAVRTKLRARLYQAAGSTDYLAAGPLRQTFVGVINEDLTADAALIRAPALLIWGENDADTPPADGRLLSHTIPHATLHIIPGAGHFAHLDAPDQVHHTIDRFLEYPSGPAL